MAFQGDSIFWVEVEKVVENPFQPRHEFDDVKLKELSESIRMYGILQPLTVTRKEIQNQDGSFRSEYELIAGERRLRASKLAGLEQVPVIIRSGEQTEQEKLELAIIENLQREDLNAVDRALAFRQLADSFGLSHAQVAKKVGRSREYVSNSIRLLQLPQCMLDSLKMSDISEGHARTLLMLRDRPEEQDVVFREILLKKLSVREVERITRKIAADKVRKKKWVNTDAELIAIEKEFTDTLGTRVQISKTDFGGKLTIDYFSDDDLQKLLAIMKQEEDEKAAAAAVEGESATVVHELSPEASLAAKLSQTTPLEMVSTTLDDIASPEPVPEGDLRHSVPQSENVPFGSDYANIGPDPEVHAAPEVTEQSAPVVEEVAREIHEVPPTDEFAFAQPVQPEVPVQEPVVHTQEPEVIVQPAPESVTTPEPQAEPVIQPEATVTPEAAANIAKSNEFNFITEPSAKAKKEDLVNPYHAQEEKKDKTQTLAAATDTEPADLPKESASDEDLYSMKNFSL